MSRGEKIVTTPASLGQGEKLSMLMQSKIFCKDNVTHKNEKSELLLADTN